jgi:hypothetical protein
VPSRFKETDEHEIGSNIVLSVTRCSKCHADQEAIIAGECYCEFDTVADYVRVRDV